MFVLVVLATLSIAACTQNAKPATTSAVPENAAPAAAAVYACPMKCEGDKTYSKAGQCPKCGMDLELVESSDNSKEGGK